MIHGLFPTSNKEDWQSPHQASSAGRTTSGADSPPFVRHADVTGPRQPKNREDIILSNPSGRGMMDPLPCSPLEDEE